MLVMEARNGYNTTNDEYEMMSVGHQHHQWSMLTEDW